ncbi:hypothetical protein D9756_008518 [Leucocoprinus leucothites]|uniref:MPN domain-containing protein n=1 Tax=Leucocoprinus leucothites TaxID=201217 RepID=A0A8H5FVS6_9AGAR|nr:hypothetical protein D9756_008518 [Leucoagaricus leucothites]
MFPHTQASSLATTPASSFYQAPHMSMSMPPQPVIHPQSQAQQMAAPPAVSMPVHSAPPPQNMNPARVLNVPPPPPLSHMASPPVADQHQQQYQHQQQQQQQQPAPYHPGSESPNPPFMFPGSSLVDLHRTPTRATVRRLLSLSLFHVYHCYGSTHIERYHQYHTGHGLPSNNIYAPSNQPNPNVMPWAAFGSQESAKSAAAAAAARVGRGLMDGSGGAGLRKSGTAKYHSPAPPPPGTENAPASSSSSVPYIPMPPPPPSAAAGLASTAGRSHPSHLERDRRQQSVSHSRHHPGSSPKERKLKPVVLPREILPRFLAIASLNTSINIETCGLLLGREVWPDGDEGGQQQHHNSSPRGGGEGRSEYMVTTLLVPRQRGTSDTCTMDGEELVLEFVDQRSLITLGWIHTHPSQSCFMSSVDLHTHSGFQQMLPEFVAVVCAPKSNPNFGIFRLTDPPGLPTILECKAKEAFHPHPDLPIYTDADKGHVHMRDAPLEIIDMR